MSGKRLFFSFFPVNIASHSVFNFTTAIYEKCRIFSLDTRQIAALAFIPEEAMENEFKTLCESKFYENNEPELTPILNYFEDT